MRQTAGTPLSRGRPRLLFVTLVLGQSAQSLAFTAFVAALPQMARDWGVRGPLMAQLTMAFCSLGMMCGSLVSGWVLERVGTRGSLIAAFLAFTLSGAEALFSVNAIALLTARVISGLAAALLATTCLWGISAEHVGAMRARVLGISSSLSNITAFAATLLGGFLASRGGWSLAFVQFPAFGVVGLVLALAGVAQVFPHHALDEIPSEPFIRRLLPFFLFAMFLFSVRFMASAQLPFVLELDGIHNAGLQAVVLAAVTVAAAFSSLAYGSIHQRFSSVAVLKLGLLSVTAALTCFGTLRSIPAAAAGCVLMGISSGLLGPYAYHEVSERSASSVRGHALGVLGAFLFLGGFLNPLVAAAIAGIVGLRGLLLCVAFSLATIAAWVSLRKTSASGDRR